MKETMIAERHVKSFVLRMGRFSASQKRSYNTLSESFLVPYQSSPINLNEVFGNDRPVTLEIGFGMGRATALIAAANAGKNYLGIEVHRPGIGKLLWEIETRALSNIRLIEYDAAIAVREMFYPESFEAIHIFFPDPWPKKRHHKRRLIQRPFTDELRAILKPGGYLYFVTDWEDYGEWAMTELGATAGLKNAYTGFAEPQGWRPLTKFEEKGLDKNHIIRELYYIRSDA